MHKLLHVPTIWSVGSVDSIKLLYMKFAYTSLSMLARMYSNVWYIISYLFYNTLTIVLYLSKSFKIYSNSLGAHWISMVSSYQWLSAKIPRKKSKRPIAMQPCPKSDQDSIPQPIKSLVLFNAVNFMTKRLWQWHLVGYLLDTIRSNMFR